MLLGYDMQDPDGVVHWHGKHPGGLHTNQPYKQWRAKMQQLADDLAAEGVEVINCSRATALTCFPRAALEDVQ